MENEDFAQAGAVFEELGIAGVRRGALRTPQLFLQAGRAYIKAGNQNKGAELLIKGLNLMAKMGQQNRIPIVGSRILDGLRQAHLST